MQARYYDPVIGRFYSNDPVGFSRVDNFNRYSYASNNPYRYIDPDGRDRYDINAARRANGLAPLGNPQLTDTQAKVLAAPMVATAAIGAVVALGTKEIVQSTFEAVTGVDVPIPSAKDVMSITSKQLGKKLGKHVQDFGGNPSSATDRQTVVDRINDIANNPDKVVSGTFSGQGPNGTRGNVNFKIQGNDVVVTTPNNDFVTVLKDGVTQNTSVKNALGGQ